MAAVQPLISTHAPREGCDLYRGCLVMSYFSLFQSTHPARGATRSGFLTPTVDQFQSTHPARGATFRCLDKKPLFGFQSTHPARGATRRYVCTNEGWRFQSTHPARGATAHKRDHARRILYFNPRTPRGVRLTLPTARAPQNTISIHAPREGCDQDIHPLLRDMYISIHAPREGCDEVQPWMFGHPVQFQSTHPARGATFVCVGV